MPQRPGEGAVKTVTVLPGVGLVATNIITCDVALSVVEVMGRPSRGGVDSHRAPRPSPPVVREQEFIHNALAWANTDIPCD